MVDAFTAEQGQSLLSLARYVLAQHFGGSSKEPVLDGAFDANYGTFVTLKIAGNLRGCIGNILPGGSVAECVRRNALSAAFHDSRFPPLTVAELAELEIDISVLSEPRTLSYTDAADLIAELRPGVDGVILTLDRASATFLPQVWEQLPEPELFLGHLCRKAGLVESAWRESQPRIEVYQVQCFEEDLP
jgi:AmmeMemoRadiSam system protein A